MKKYTLYAYIHPSGDVWWCGLFYDVLEMVNRRGLMSVGKIIKWDDYMDNVKSEPREVYHECQGGQQMKSYERRLECWQCLRCDHLWQKRPGDRPVTCPSCKNKLWAVTPTRKPGAGRKKQQVVDPIVDVSSRQIPLKGDQNVAK